MASLCHLSPPHLLNLLPPFPSQALRSSPKSYGLRFNPSRRSLPPPRSRGGGAVRCSEQSRDRSGEPHSSDRTPFDLNLAVLLAGFAFEAYTSPPSDVGIREVDGGGSQTVFLSEQFLREIYDGKIVVKLKKGLEFPSMDPWGTSDPYVVIRIEGQAVKSTTKWGTKEPTWNEDLTLNINRNAAKLLQVAAWDANLITSHKRMGNAGIDLSSLCDGNSHELVVELEGIGGGGKVHLEVKYKSFDDINKEKQWWGNIPFLSELIPQNNLESALKSVLGTESVNVSQFVEYAFGQLSSFNLSPQHKVPFLDDPITEAEAPKDIADAGKIAHEVQPEHVPNESTSESFDSHEDILVSKSEDTGKTALEKNNNDQSQVSEGYFWKKLAGSINQAVNQKLGFSLPISDLARWDGYGLLSKINILSQRNAEEEYIQSGLAAPEALTTPNSDCASAETSPPSSVANSSAFDIKNASREILSQTDNVLGALMVLTTLFSQQQKGMPSTAGNGDKDELSRNGDNITPVNETNDCTFENQKVKVSNIHSSDMRDLFSTAESAMEAWAMLCTSLGRASFIKSEFQKICFLDNDDTDTQVAIWRDHTQKRLVIAFRGTEQTRWKDLRTDLMLVPSGLNPERLGGNFKEEVQVHSGFLSAYDSVRNRIMALVNSSIGFHGTDDFASLERWHVYVTGHSLGGALATLLALELSSSRLAKCNVISVTMYNFGSPRVGNRRFVEGYNQNVKDSWRIVNHRDIIPTVPRLMGYCHVAQPIYLAVGELMDVSMEHSEDGYRVDIIGDYTPDVLVNEFMKGEKELVQKILETEINLFSSLRDGSALMQHMEDFYYIALLERVKSNYSMSSTSATNEKLSQP